MRHLTWLVVLLLIVSPSASPASAAEALPVTEQNALVQKHCAVCHNDRAMNGGLSLQRFDASDVAPSLAAMMISKLTSGLPLAAVGRASSDPGVAAQLAKRLMSGAIMAAGVAPPDVATAVALATALAEKSRHANTWHVSLEPDPKTKTLRTTASILREVTRKEDEVESYRLVLTCDTTSREGHVEMAWSPVPTVGRFSVIADGTEFGPYSVEGKESMGNGVGSSNGLAAFRFPDSLLPFRSLVVRDLFPNETVEFSFSSLPLAARQELASCFARK